MSRPDPRVRPGLERLLRGTRRRGRAIAVLTTVSAVGAVAFVQLTTAGAATPAAVPATDLAYLKEAAQSCPALTPAKLAGQIMGPKRAVKDSAIVASVGPGSWEAWAPWPGASPADHRAKIFALAHQTCDFVGQLRVAKVAGDPWRNAVAAGHVGIAAVKAEKGVPRTAKAFVDTVAACAAYYAEQKQFGGAGPKPAPTTTAPAPTTAAPTTTAAATTTAPATTVPPTTGPTSTVTALPATTAAPTPITTPTTDPGATDPGATDPAFADPAAKYQITNPFAGRVLELPGDDTNTITGTPVQIWSDLKSADQYWRITAASAAGYVKIVNDSSGKALAVRDDSMDDFAGVDQVPVTENDKGQEWELRPAGGDGEMWIVNRLSGKALDLFGDDLAATDGAQVDLWALQTGARDQRWTITR